MTSIGIDLEHRTPAVLDGESVREESSFAPVAVLAPLHSLPPVRCELHAIDEPWNCGLPGKRETAFDGNCARVPLWAAWEAVNAGVYSPTWSYRSRSGQKLSASLQSIFSALLKEASLAESDFHTIAIPNDLDEWGQDTIIRAAIWPEDRTHLLWRPVAASMAYFDAIPTQRHDEFADRHIIDVDLRMGQLAMTILKTRQETVGGKSFIAPIRRPPMDGVFLARSFPPLDLCLADSLLRGADIETTQGLLWYLTVGNSSLLGVKSVEVQEAFIPASKTWKRLELGTTLFETHVDNLVKKTPSKTVRGLFGRIEQHIPNGKRMPPLDLTSGLLAGIMDEICRFTQKCCQDHDVTGMLIHGPLTRMGTIGAQLKGFMGQRIPELVGSIAIEGRDQLPDSLVARGCSLFAARLERDLPTYYDHLNGIDIIVQEHEEIVRKPLIEAKVVKGGSEYRPSEPVTGCSVNQEESFIRFYLSLEGFPKLRELKQDLEEITTTAEDLNLYPSQRPARGHARVEVHNDRLFPRYPALLDWQKMKETDETIESLQAKVERSYPPYYPDVKTSWEKWQDFTFDCRFYLDSQTFEDGKEQNIERMLDDQFFAKIAAVSYDENSELGLGRLNVFGSGKSDSLPTSQMALDFLERLQTDFRECKKVRNRDKLIRAMAWTYQCDCFPELREFLLDKLKNSPEDMKVIELTACAQLFDEPEEFRAFFDATLELFWQRGTERMTNYIRNLRKLMCYRQGMLEHIDSGKCREMMLFLARVLEDQNDQGKFANTSLLTILSVLFLLKRRRFDESFLSFDPEWPEGLTTSLGNRRWLFVGCSPKAKELPYRLIALVWRTTVLLEKAIIVEGQRHLDSGRTKQRLRMVEEIEKYIMAKGTLAGFVQAFKQAD